MTDPGLDLTLTALRIDSRLPFSLATVSSYLQAVDQETGPITAPIDLDNGLRVKICIEDLRVLTSAMGIALKLILDADKPAAPPAAPAVGRLAAINNRLDQVAAMLEEILQHVAPLPTSIKRAKFTSSAADGGTLAATREPASHAAELDELRSQMQALSGWLSEHTDQPKGLYGPVETAINAMAAFQRHINRSAEVWAENRCELEKLRAQNAALTARIPLALSEPEADQDGDDRG